VAADRVAADQTAGADDPGDTGERPAEAAPGATDRSG
jgi:hypothetical protein